MSAKARALVAVALLVGAGATAGAVALPDGKAADAEAKESPPSTGTVEKGTLSATVSLDGTLTHRARADGSPYVAINKARGTYTALPEVGDEVDCGGVLYRVDDTPVLLLCGTVPAYRRLRVGDAGEDVRQLNRNLHRLGYDADAGGRLERGDDAFSVRTGQALEALQRDRGSAVTGTLGPAGAVFMPGPVRIARVSGELGAAARPGAPVAQATSDVLEVQVSLDPSQRDAVRKTDRARITLPDNTSVTGTVARIGDVAQAPAGQNGGSGEATIPAYIRLDHPGRARRFDQSPVQVEIVTRGVDRALSVPVTAIVGRSGDGFAVEVVADGGRRRLVAVRLGLVDSTAGRVQVDGALREGDAVVVPSP